MREIKFRAWDTHKNKMYSPEELGQDELTINPDGRGFVNVNGSSQRLSQYMYHILPMQFIGSKDKNGKEIYESDIWIYRCVILENGKDVFKTSVALVEWAGMGFNLKPLSDCWFYNNITEGEIIGNIFENPELLPMDA